MQVNVENNLLLNNDYYLSYVIDMIFFFNIALQQAVFNYYANILLNYHGDSRNRKRVAAIFGKILSIQWRNVLIVAIQVQIKVLNVVVVIVNEIKVEVVSPSKQIIMLTIYAIRTIVNIDLGIQIKDIEIVIVNNKI